MDTNNGAGHLVTTTFAQPKYKIKFDWNPYSFSQNALFDEAIRSAQQIFQIFKIEEVIFVDHFRLANRY